MSIKIERNENYLVVTDTVSSDVKNVPTTKVRFSIYSDTLHLIYMDRAELDIAYPLTDLVDKNGDAWESTDVLTNWLRDNTGGLEGAIDVVVQDSTSPILIVHFSNIVGETDITSPLSLDDYTVDVTSVTGMVVGHLLTVYNVAEDRVYFGNILSIDTLTVTLDTPLDFPFPAGSIVTFGITNMNVNGSVTPQIFGVRNPQAADIPSSVDVVRIVFNCLTDTAPILTDFGDIAAGLLRGVVIRRVDGTYQNVFNVKTNSDIKNIAFDFDIEVASGTAKDGFTSRLTFGGWSKMGAVIRIGENEDLQCIIQDDLTSLVEFEIIAEGSFVVD